MIRPEYEIPEFDFEKYPLTTKEKGFCENYVGGKTLFRAITESGHEFTTAKRNTIENYARQTLKKDAVKEYVKYLNRISLSKAVMSKSEALIRLTKIARFNIKSLAAWNEVTVELKDSREVTDDASYAITRIKSSDGKVDVVTEDKVKALTKIIDHYEKVEGLNDHGRAEVSAKHRQNLIERVQKYISGNK